MIAHIEYRPARSVPTLLHEALALLQALWTTFTARRTQDTGIDWEDGESS